MVEQQMALCRVIVTMRKNGIELPPSFLTVASGFKPKHSPEEKKN